MGLGSGGTWPGEIALHISPNILSNLTRNISKGIILVAGTNGKTTTSLMISNILQKNNERVILNNSGANLLNGVISALIKNADWTGRIKSDWGVFEVDENSLPAVILNFKFQISSKKKIIIVLTNLFRDQLDRYGEVDVIAEKWQKALGQLSKNCTVILNSDDPQIAFLGKQLNCKILYFGLIDKKYYISQKEHATDSIFCINCGARLLYKGVFYSHLGDWYCKSCGFKRPIPYVSEWKQNIPGVYNLYNTLAAVSVGRVLGYSDAIISNALDHFTPAFGRQEEFETDEKNIKIFLSKNPVGFNQSLRTILNLGAQNILFVLNDRIPDGRDVSWIWDVDFEMIPESVSVVVSGDRVYDLAIRLKYRMKQCNNVTMKQLLVEENLKSAITSGLKLTKKGETLYILPTYSAMLEVRKIISGRKIL